MHSTLVYLDQIRHNLRHNSYEIILQSIKDLDKKFAPTALLKKGHFIERARINHTDNLYTRKDEVGYIIDEEVLKTRVSFGRANNEHQSIFYGAIRSPEIDKPRAVAYFETTSRLDELSTPGPFREVFTISRWRILEDIKVLEMIYSDAYLDNSEYVRMSLENQIRNQQAFIDYFKRTRGVDITDHLVEQGKFFSNEFARNDIESPEDYKISAAYSNYIWQETDCLGVTYPSVKARYIGQNVALLPDAVDKYLKLESVYLCVCERQYSEEPVAEVVKMAIDLGKDQSDFKWTNA
ncbi:hypothetical protein GCM10028818_01160 [Spirosoma horti]